MQIIKQISSLEKVRTDSNMNYREITSKTLLKGERFSYQIATKMDIRPNEQNLLVGKIEVDSPLEAYIKLFYVDNAVMDCPITEPQAALDANYITTKPGLMPDILIPTQERNNILSVSTTAHAVWVEINLPKDIAQGTYPVTIRLRNIDPNGVDLTDEFAFAKTMTIEVVNEEIQPQSLIYTRWFYADCIADYHQVEPFSEKHWELIEKYIIQAVDGGVNMILVPVHTPPLDTAIGHRRTCVQLVDIKKSGNSYSFGFDKFRRFIEICKRCNIKYYEIAHLFSQWGAQYAPNIMVEENGKKDYLFGWHVPSNDEAYIDFLRQYISAISKELKKEGIDKNTYFHISDEPTIEKIDSYKTASEIIRPLIGDSKTFDALSEYDFYEKGLVKCPVTAIDHMKDFIDKNIENQWIYYCCGPQSTFCNSTLAMPSARVRMLGLLIYKYDIKGFLHWGFNYYNGRISRYAINPYATTSSDGSFPSGDPFIVYPSKDGAYSSVRSKITREAIDDINMCRTLEKYIGRQAVIELIEQSAGGVFDFENYPVGNDFLIDLREKMVEIITEKSK